MPASFGRSVDGIWRSSYETQKKNDVSDSIGTATIARTRSRSNSRSVEIGMGAVLGGASPPFFRFGLSPAALPDFAATATLPFCEASGCGAGEAGRFSLPFSTSGLTMVNSGDGTRRGGRIPLNIVSMIEERTCARRDAVRVWARDRHVTVRPRITENQTEKPKTFHCDTAVA
jgi:hypothetical protein